ncbi:MAG: hypothetical protein QOG75_2176 [Mycobacterium sp.]|nr:hypothetical protein [Mycobacterium sp.]
MSSNDFDPFHTDDLTNPADWWQWVVLGHGELISQAATTLGAAVISAALGVAGAQLKASGSKLANPALVASGLVAAGFAGNAALQARSRRQTRR